jgi:hypothetical protein
LSYPQVKLPAIPEPKTNNIAVKKMAKDDKKRACGKATLKFYPKSIFLESFDVLAEQRQSDDTNTGKLPRAN